MGVTARIVIGTALVAVGVGILLDRLEIWDFGVTVATYWPLILIFLGLVQIFTRSAPAWVALLLLLLGGFFLARNLDIIPEGWTVYILPGVLVFVGLLILLGPALRRRRRKGPAWITPQKGTSKEGWIERVAIFGGAGAKSRADPFSGGELTAIFGGVELDLQGARLGPEGADLEVTVIFGGAEVIVPKDWRVEVAGTPVLGGIETKALEPTAEDAPVLRIDATAIFGGIEIRNPK